MLGVPVVFAFFRIWVGLGEFLGGTLFRIFWMTYANHYNKSTPYP